MSSSYPGDLSSAIEMEAEDLKGAGSGDLRSDLADLKKDLDALLGKALPHRPAAQPVSGGSERPIAGRYRRR